MIEVSQTMAVSVDPQAALRNFQKSHEFFIGIDSDGCVFDTMEVKHKECFIPNIIQYYGLAAVSKFAREAAEFVNLYSKDRGINRFHALVRTIDLLAERPEIARRGFQLPSIEAVRQWTQRETKLSNPVLTHEVHQNGVSDLASTLEWSEAVNRTIGKMVENVPPFPFVREAISSMQGKADVMVVSATPSEALEREWEEHGLKEHVQLIAGQELGSKKEHLQLAAVGRYDLDKILMIGDAPGDRKAAEANGVLFYPINPGAEDESWQRFFEEALPRFFSGTYAGEYMAERIAEFEALLPEHPPWNVA